MTTKLAAALLFLALPVLVHAGPGIEKPKGLRDAVGMERLAASWDVALAKGKTAVLRRLDAELGRRVKNEIPVGRKEVIGDEAKVRREREEGVVKREATPAEIRLRRRCDVALALERLAGSLDEPSLREKRALLGEMITMANEERAEQEKAN